MLTSNLYRWRRRRVARVEKLRQVCVSRSLARLLASSSPLRARASRPPPAVAAARRDEVALDAIQEPRPPEHVSLLREPVPHAQLGARRQLCAAAARQRVLVLLRRRRPPPQPLARALPHLPHARQIRRGVARVGRVCHRHHAPRRPRRALVARLRVVPSFKAKSGWSSKASVEVERRRGRGLKARTGRRETTGKVLKDRRPPRRRGRMGTSVR